MSPVRIVPVWPILALLLSTLPAAAGDARHRVSQDAAGRSESTSITASRWPIPIAGWRPTSAPRPRWPIGWPPRTRSPPPTWRRSPSARRIRRRLTELWNFAQYSSPMKEGGRYYYLKNDGLQNQAVLYVMDSLDGTAARAAGSQPVVQGRHDRPGRPGLQRRRQVHGLRPLRGRLRLVHLAGHGDRHRATCCPTS